MFEEPEVVMTQNQLPQQRLHAVVGLPERPEGFRGHVEWHQPLPEKDSPTGSPRKLEFLGSVEWTWGFRNDRWDAYYLNPRGKYWLLWIRSLDESGWIPKWRWTLYAWGLRRGVPAKQAAVYLLNDAWAAERDHSDMGWFSYINDSGYVSVAELCAIGRQVWPEGEFDE